jgi:hypothetical protein
VQVRLSDFALAGVLAVNDTYNFAAAAHDPATGSVYFGTLTSPGVVVKVLPYDLPHVLYLPGVAHNAAEP